MTIRSGLAGTDQELTCSFRFDNNVQECPGMWYLSQNSFPYNIYTPSIRVERIMFLLKKYFRYFYKLNLVELLLFLISMHSVFRHFRADLFRYLCVTSQTCVDIGSLDLKCVLRVTCSADRVYAQEMNVFFLISPFFIKPLIWKSFKTGIAFRKALPSCSVINCTSPLMEFLHLDVHKIRSIRGRMPYMWRQICRNSLVIINVLENKKVVRIPVFKVISRFCISSSDILTFEIFYLE